MPKEMLLDPVTRIEGHLGVRVIVNDDGTIDRDSVRVFVTMFRGFEVFLRGRRPEDAIHITSRLCGVCGAAHANASIIANDMALGVLPTELGVALRNMAHAMTDHIYDHPTILSMLQGPDFSAAIVGTLTPKVWAAAKETPAEFKDRHGFATIADIMEALNPISGKVWQLSIRYQRIAREAGVLLYGRHSHPSTLIPGGITTDLTNLEHLLIGYTFRLVKLTAWAKFIYYLWHDLVNFMKENGCLDAPEAAGCNYKEQGKTELSPGSGEFPVLASSGIFEDPEEYANMGETPEEIYANIDKAADKRFLKLGIIKQGTQPPEIITRKYTDYNVGLMETVEHAFYEEWDNKFTDTDYLGNLLLWGKEDAKWHPWNKITIPKPGAKDWADRYTWAAVVRFVWKDGSKYPVEVGPIARLISQAWYDQTEPYKSGGGRIEVTLPRAVDDILPSGVWEEDTLVYEAPAYSTTLERLWARAFNVALDVAAAWHNVVYALSYVKAGRPIKTSRWDRSHPARMTFGVGFNEAPRGTVRHWLVQKGGRILNYQIHASTTSNVPPLGRDGKPAPFEASVRNTVISENAALGLEGWTGLDFMRSIRSFDPCLACAVHIQFGREPVKVVKKLISPTCGP